MQKNRKLSALLLAALILNTGTAFSQDAGSVQSYKPSSLIQADIESQRIPKGTLMKIRIENPVNSQNSRNGDQFIATIIEDIKVNNAVILPVGTTIRGRVVNIKQSGYLSRGGEMNLRFDHVVTPIGRQIPVAAKISSSKNLDSNGIISAGGGYFNAVEKNLDKGVDIVTKTSAYGIKGGLSIAGGIPVILTAPISIAGGITVGSTYFFAKSVHALIEKGNNVKFNPGDTLTISLSEALDVPVN